MTKLEWRKWTVHQGFNLFEHALYSPYCYIIAAMSNTNNVRKCIPSGQVLPFIPSPLPSNFSKSEIGLAELWLTFISNFAHSG